MKKSFSKILYTILFILLAACQTVTQKIDQNRPGPWPGPLRKWIDKMIIGRENDYIRKKYIIIIHKLC